MRTSIELKAEAYFSRRGSGSDIASQNAQPGICVGSVKEYFLSNVPLQLLSMILEFFVRSPGPFLASPEMTIQPQTFLPAGDNFAFPPA